MFFVHFSAIFYYLHDYFATWSKYFVTWCKYISCFVVFAFCRCDIQLHACAGRCAEYLRAAWFLKLKKYVFWLILALQAPKSIKKLTFSSTFSIFKNKLPHQIHQFPSAGHNSPHSSAPSSTHHSPLDEPLGGGIRWGRRCVRGGWGCRPMGGARGRVAAPPSVFSSH